MIRVGYTLMTEQSGPAELVRYATAAERAGFDFAVSSDHYSPWLASQGHAPNAWTMLGAVAQATERIELMTYVTCPTTRYHPTIVAQQAATLQILAGGRFVLGLGSGENLNEHVVGQGWPAPRERQDRLVEAIHIIRALFGGDLLDWTGEHYRVDSARLWDLPDIPVPIAVAVSGPRGVAKFAPLGDHLIAVAPDAALIDDWQHARRPATGLPANGRAIGQLPICWDPDRAGALDRAHRQFRWFGGGWPVDAELRTPDAVAAASRFVTPQNVADRIPCGPDLDGIVAAVREYAAAGFTDVALVQIGDEGQQRFLDEAAPRLLASITDR